MGFESGSRGAAEKETCLECLLLKLHVKKTFCPVTLRLPHINSLGRLGSPTKHTLQSFVSYSNLFPAAICVLQSFFLAVICALQSFVPCNHLFLATLGLLNNLALWIYISSFLFHSRSCVKSSDIRY